MINVYLFDLDDTLVDTKIYAEIYSTVLGMVKEKLNINDELLEDKAEELGLEKNKFDRWDTGDLCRKLGFLEEYYKILEEKINVLPVLHDNVQGVFSKLNAEGKKIGIVSNSMARTINAYLKKYDLNEYVDFVFSFDDAGCLKRSDDYWKTLIEKHNLVPRKCLVIGDDIRDDVKMPKMFGFNTFLIKSSEDLKVL